MSQTYSPRRRERYRQLLLQGVSPTALVMASPTQQRHDARMHLWVCKLLAFWRQEETRFPEWPTRGTDLGLERSARQIRRAMVEHGVALGDMIRKDVAGAMLDATVADAVHATEAHTA
jgi:hypothetical protein